MNILKRIDNANAGRDAELLALKYRALRASPFQFMRGTARLFYQRLARAGLDLPAPLVWCSGDLHLQNFGSYHGDNRLVYFDINDFDEAALAPASWELVRLAASIEVALAGLGVASDRAGALVTGMIGHYAHTLGTDTARWIERDTAQGVVRTMLDQLRERSRAEFLDRRTTWVDGQRRLRVDGDKALPVTSTQRARVTRTVHRFAKHQAERGFFRVLDVARRIAGTGSLGLPRYVVLVEGDGAPSGHYLLDLKLAMPSALGQVFHRHQPRWPDEATRISAVQARMQAVSAACLQPLRHRGLPFVLRFLQPSEDRLPFEQFGKQDALFDGAMGMMARCTAWDQLRSSGWRGAANADALIAFAGQKKWQRQVAHAASAMAAQVMADWDTYRAAYDAGRFPLAQGGR